MIPELCTINFKSLKKQLSRDRSRKCPCETWWEVFSLSSCLPLIFKSLWYKQPTFSSFFYKLEVDNSFSGWIMLSLPVTPWNTHYVHRCAFSKGEKKYSHLIKDQIEVFLFPLCLWTVCPITLHSLPSLPHVAIPTVLQNLEALFPHVPVPKQH